MMEVKGSAVVTIPMFVREKFGDQGLKKWQEALSPQAREVFGATVLASSWYPLTQIMIEPTVKICDLFYQGQLKGAWDSGRFSAAHGLKGIYKLFVQLGSPGFLVKKASTILPTYYKPSVMELKESEKDRAVVHMTQFPEASPVAEARICGWIQQALEISGCKDVAVVVGKSLTRKDPFTEFRITWR